MGDGNLKCIGCLQLVGCGVTTEQLCVCACVCVCAYACGQMCVRCVCVRMCAHIYMCVFVKNGKNESIGVTVRTIHE